MRGSRLGGALRVIAPGILVAATGVGAGDLATGAFTGQALKLTVLWAVLIGATMKFLLTEGLTRWQLATGDTLLEGSVAHLGRPLRWIFLGYLLIWRFLVGAALMGAVGATCHAMYPLFPATTGDAGLAAAKDKIVYGLLHSGLALLLVWWGSFRLFERVMAGCIGVMFVVVIVTAAALRPPLEELARGLVPTIPDQPQAINWTIALIGGVGGTLTIVCYGYWIREEGRSGSGALRTCRLDLATGYLVTALFGMSMVVIGSRVSGISGRGTDLIVQLADRLSDVFGSAGVVVRWAFLIGAWGAVFSSLLGTWQSVPYLFADFWRLTRTPSARRVDTRSPAYRGYLLGLSTVPTIGLIGWNLRSAQLLYAVVGALCIPLLAIVLLLLNGRSTWVGPRYRNSWLTNLLLLATLAFFLYAGWSSIRTRLM